MSQQRVLQLSLLGALLLGAFAIVYLVVSKRSGKPDPAHSVVKHSVGTPPDEALKYWTAEKKRRAKGVKMPHVKALDQEEKHTQHPPRPADPRHS
jgi:hypothetical protein